MRYGVLITIMSIALAAGVMKAAEPDAKELAQKGYTTFRMVLAGDEAKLPEAIRYMEEAQSADATDANNLFNLARAYFFEVITFGKMESVEKAEKTFARVIELDPKNMDALSFHGSILTQMSAGRDIGKFMKGAGEMKAAVAQSPNNIGSRIILAFTARNFPPQGLAAMGNYNPDDDLQFVAKFLTPLNSDFAPHAGVVMNAFVAEAYKAKGDEEKARSSFQTALNIEKPADPGQLAGREMLDKVINARMKGGDKPIFDEPIFGGCHSCHLGAPEKLLSR